MNLQASRVVQVIRYVPTAKRNQTRVLRLATASYVVNVGHECTAVSRVRTKGSGDTVPRLGLKLNFKMDVTERFALKLFVSSGQSR